VRASDSFLVEGDNFFSRCHRSDHHRGSTHSIIATFSWSENQVARKTARTPTRRTCDCFL